MDDVTVTGAWFKAQASNPGGNCVETAAATCGGGPVVVVRDSADPDGPRLVVRPAGWRALLTGIRDA